MGKSANDSVNIIVDDKGITTASDHVNSFIGWQDVNAIEQTEKGLLLRHRNGVNYLSNTLLGEALAELILSRKNN
jgi:hypothetical protein